MKYIKTFEQNNQLNINDKLIDACVINNIKQVKKLIEQGADVNFIDDNGYTPLIYAVNNRADINIIKFLIDNGADVNFQSNTTDGWTPLILAAFYESTSLVDTYSIIDLLIDSGADWYVKGKLINITFFDYLSIENKRKIKIKYPEKYKDYLLKKDIYKFNL